MGLRVKIACTILAHDKRKKQALELEKKIKSQGLECDITWDKINKQWETAQRGLEKVKDSDWAIILEDDAIIGDNFVENALRAIESVPEPTLISFYTGTFKPFHTRTRKAVEKAQRENASWLSFNRLNWGVAIAIHSKHIQPLLQKVQRSHLPYDERIGLYFRLTNRKVYYTYPSIVNHRDGESINKGKPKGIRKAHVYSDELLDFSGKIIPL